MKARLPRQTLKGMARRLYASGYFNDATSYALNSIPKIVVRWWPLYVVAIVCGVTNQYLSNSLVKLLNELLSGSIIVITTAVQFRGPLHVSQSLIKGFALTSVLLTVALWTVGLLLPHPLPHDWTLLVYLIGCVLYFWITTKLAGAKFFFLLGNDGETALEAYAAAWKFISGDVWWQIFFISLVGAIPLVIVIFVTLRIAPPHSNLEPLRYGLNAIISTAYSVFINSAVFRIVGTAAHLHGRYREAYQNSAQ